jgi:hypothetical protein
MDLSYPPAVQDSLDRIGKALADVTVRDEAAAIEHEPELWQTQPSRNGHTAPASSPLAQVAEFRALGFYALPLPELLEKTDRSYLPNAAGVALGWPDASAPWQPGDSLTVELNGSKLNGAITVAPFNVPARGLLLVAQSGSDVALIQTSADGSRTERRGDAHAVSFENADAGVLATGPEAEQAWQRAVEWERLALLGLTAGLIDRSWRIALDALCEGKRAGNELADEQVAQFQLADNDIDRLAAEHLILDAAIDADNRKPHAAAKVALARYFTSGQAERCSARALHVAQLFLPRLVPVARWLSRRAHHLSVFGMAREHEVRFATAGLTAGLILE